MSNIGGSASISQHRGPRTPPSSRARAAVASYLSHSISCAGGVSPPPSSRRSPRVTKNELLVRLQTENNHLQEQLDSQMQLLMMLQERLCDGQYYEAQQQSLSTEEERGRRLIMDLEKDMRLLLFRTTVEVCKIQQQEKLRWDNQMRLQEMENASIVEESFASQRILRAELEKLKRWIHRPKSSFGVQTGESSCGAAAAVPAECQTDDDDDEQPIVLTTAEAGCSTPNAWWEAQYHCGVLEGVSEGHFLLAQEAYKRSVRRVTSRVDRETWCTCSALHNLLSGGPGTTPSGDTVGGVGRSSSSQTENEQVLDIGTANPLPPNLLLDLSTVEQPYNPSQQLDRAAAESVSLRRQLKKAKYHSRRYDQLAKRSALEAESTLVIVSKETQGRFKAERRIVELEKAFGELSAALYGPTAAAAPTTPSKKAAPPLVEEEPSALERLALMQSPVSHPSDECNNTNELVVAVVDSAAEVAALCREYRDSPAAIAELLLEERSFYRHHFSELRTEVLVAMANTQQHSCPSNYHIGGYKGNEDPRSSSAGARSHEQDVAVDSLISKAVERLLWEGAPVLIDLCCDVRESLASTAQTFKAVKEFIVAAQIRPPTSTGTQEEVPSPNFLVEDQPSRTRRRVSPGTSERVGRRSPRAGRREPDPVVMAATAAEHKHIELLVRKQRDVLGRIGHAVDTLEQLSYRIEADLDRAVGETSKSSPERQHWQAPKRWN